MIRITKQDIINSEVLSGKTLTFDNFLRLNNGYEDEEELWETNRNWSFDVNEFVDKIKEDYIKFCRDNGFRTYIRLKDYH